MGDAGGPGGNATGRLHVPDVNRRGASWGSAVAVAETIHKCVGAGFSLTRKSLSPTSKASSNLSAPVFLGTSSLAAKASAEPSGLQANC